MKQFSVEQIQNQFNKLPEELRNAITSMEVSGTIQAVGNRHGLRIDQMGELVDMIGLVMLGLMKPGDFVSSFVKETGVDRQTAQKIAEDINKELFTVLKTSMQEVQRQEQEKETEVLPEIAPETTSSDISSVEQAGNFEIEREAPPKESRFGDISHTDKDRLLSGIEDNHTDPLLDRLLPNAKGTSSTQTQVPPPKKQDGKPDPYREPV